MRIVCLWAGWPVGNGRERVHRDTPSLDPYPAIVSFVVHSMHHR
jgi:hypothetical protein